MFAFARRLLDQLYHSLTDEVKVAGRFLVEACVRSSTFRTSEVGPQVFVAKLPVPRNVLWYHGQADALVVKAATWKPSQAPPPRMYVSNPVRWAAVCGRSSRNSTTWYALTPPLASRSQLLLEV